MTSNTPEEIKTCLLNLIFYSQESRRFSYFSELLHEISHLFPSRIIFIQGDSKAGPYLKSSRETLQDPPFSCDEIHIEAAGDDLKKVPYFILPHLIPDLPICLLWGHDPVTEKEILPNLLKYSNRLIFDSDCTNHLPQFSKRMVMEAKKWPCEVIDMNWARINGWRQILAQLFEPSGRTADLKNCTAISISYNEAPSPAFTHPEMQAYYLQAWIATQLRWKWISKSPLEKGTRFIYSSRRKQITVDLIGKLSPLSPGSILSVEMQMANQRSYSLIRNEKASQQVFVNISSETTCDLPLSMPLPSRSKGISFIREILFLPVSTQYFDMLHTISAYDF